MKNKKTSSASYVKTQTGGFNLGNSPVSLEAVEALFPVVQNSIRTLPNGKQKTTLGHAFATISGYVAYARSCEWLQSIGLASPIEA